MKALLLTLIAGSLFLLGALVAFFGKKNRNLIDFSLGMAFSVMVLLISSDIVPETIELLGEERKFLLIIFILIGIIILKLIDLLIPHHDHQSEIKHHERHLKHIGSISSLALVIHNVIEGIGIYNLSVIDFKMGLTMAIAVGLHNIPLGIEITATLNETKKNNKQIFINILLLALSTVLGAVIMLIFGTISDYVLGCVMSVTVGMIIYLILFELLPECINSKNKKVTLFGTLVGSILMIINLLIS